MSRSENLSARTGIIKARLDGILARLSPPRAMTGNAAAMAAEIAALESAIASSAPSQGLEAWLDRFEMALVAAATTRAWPLVSEVFKAAAEATRQGRAADPAPSEPGWVLDSHRINAGRIKRGEPVGEFWLWGRPGQELLQRGLVTEDDLIHARMGHFEALGEEYDESVVKRLMLDLNERHRAALPVVIAAREKRATTSAQRREVAQRVQEFGRTLARRNAELRAAQESEQQRILREEKAASEAQVAYSSFTEEERKAFVQAELAALTARIVALRSQLSEDDGQDEEPAVAAE